MTHITPSRRARAARRAALLCGILLAGASVASAAPPTLPYRLMAAKFAGGSPLDAGTPAFDSRGVAYLRDDANLDVVSPGGSTRKLDIKQIAKAAIDTDQLAGPKGWDGSFDSGPMVDIGIVVDTADRIYTLVIPRYSNLKHAVLLWSADHAATWRAIALQGVNATMEKPDGFNDHSGPPTVISFENYGASNGTHLWLDPLTVRDGKVVHDGEPVLVSDRSLLVANHSGGANSTFTTPSKIFIVYPEDGSPTQGTAISGRQYDRAGHAFDDDTISIGRSLSLKGPDPHDTPGITADSHGTLSVVIPGHQSLMSMVSSKRPWTLKAGWTTPSQIGEPRRNNMYGFYTYPTLNTSKDGTINIVARAEGNNGLDRLVQMRKPAGGAWTVWPNKTVEREIAVPQRANYVAWRQKMSMSGDGRLYLNFRYYADNLTTDEASAVGLAGTKAAGGCRNGRCFYGDVPTLAPLTLVSSDEGASWHHP